MALRVIDDPTIGNALARFGNTVGNSGQIQMQGMKLGFEMEKARREMLLKEREAQQKEELRKRQTDIADTYDTLQPLETLNRSGAGWTYGMEPGWQGPLQEPQANANQLALDEQIAVKKREMASRIMRAGAEGGDFGKMGQAYKEYAQGQNFIYGAPKAGTSDYDTRQSLLTGKLEPTPAPNADQRKQMLNVFAQRVANGEKLTPEEVQTASSIIAELQAAEPKVEANKQVIVRKPLDDPSIRSLADQVRGGAPAAPPPTTSDPAAPQAINPPGGSPATTGSSAVAPAAPSPAVAPAAPAARGGLNTSSFEVVGDVGPPKEAPEGLRNASVAVQRVQNDRKRLEQIVGYNTNTGVLADNYYVPSALLSDLGRKVGSQSEVGMAGLGAAEKFFRGDTKLNEYMTVGDRMVEPILRLASGSATPDPEVIRYGRMFMPNANDNRETIIGKFEAIKLWEKVVASSSTMNEALANMQKAAAENPSFAPIALQQAQMLGDYAAKKGTLDTPMQPGAGAAPDASQAPQARELPKVGDVVNDRVYLGGDPTKRESWQ